MKTTSLYFLLVIVFICFSCDKEEPIPNEGTNPMEEEEVEVEDIPAIELIYPLEEDEVHYCCFTMEWEDSGNEDEYRIQISKSNYTQNILFDTIITGTSFEFPFVLLPSEEYYWKVIPKDEEESQSGIFRIIDYIAKLRGTYTASIHSYSWALFEGSLDTTHQTSLKIFRGDDHTITYETDHTYYHPEIPFKEERHEDFVLFEIDHGYPTNSDYLKYYFDTDSISIYSESGGNGGGGNRTITAVYEN